MKYFIYNKSTGEVRSIMTCSLESQVIINCNGDEAYLDFGGCDDRKQYIIDLENRIPIEIEVVEIRNYIKEILVLKRELDLLNVINEYGTKKVSTTKIKNTLRKLIKEWENDNGTN